MKSFLSFFCGAVLLSGLIFSLQGCLKDHCTHSRQFKVFTPVYQSLSEVRKAVKAEDPHNLQHTGKIYYHQGYLFLNEVNQGIHIIDDRDPSAPKNIAFINIPGNLDMAARGNILYADSYTDMLAINISDPSNIKITRRIKDVFPPRGYNYGFRDEPAGQGMITGFTSKDTTVNEACDLPLNRGGWYYDAAADQSFLNYSVANAAAPSSLPAQGSTGGSMAKFTTLSHYLYTLTGNQQLSLYDISQPALPEFKDQIDIGWNIETIFPYGNYFFIGSTTGMYIYDAAIPEKPVRKSQFMHAFGCDPVVAQDNYAYVTIRNGTTCHQASVNELNIINIADLSSPNLVSTLNLTNPHGLAIDGNQLFVCDATGGIRFIDITDKSHPKIITTIKGVNAIDAISLNGKLIIVARDGLYQYDYQNFSQPKLLSKLSLSSK